MSFMENSERSRRKYVASKRRLLEKSRGACESTEKESTFIFYTQILRGLMPKLFTLHFLC